MPSAERSQLNGHSNGLVVVVAVIMLLVVKVVKFTSLAVVVARQDEQTQHTYNYESNENNVIIYPRARVYAFLFICAMRVAI